MVIVGLLMFLAVPLAGGAQGVLLTEIQAAREIFPEAVRSRVETRILSDDALHRLSRHLGRPVEGEARKVTLYWDAGGKFLGYSSVAEEIGKYRPITFMVGVTPQFTVRDVAVLVYRESRGGDVKRKRFLAQYRGKSAKSPIDSNRDIINISGATISVRSMNAGVKRVLAEISTLYDTNTPR